MNGVSHHLVLTVLFFLCKLIVDLCQQVVDLDLLLALSLALLGSLFDIVVEKEGSSENHSSH